MRGVRCILPLALMFTAEGAAQPRPRDPLFVPEVIAHGDRWFCTSSGTGRFRLSPCFRDAERCADWVQERRDRGEPSPACRPARVAFCVTYDDAEGETGAICQRDVGACNNVRRVRFEMNRQADRYPSLHGDEATSNISGCNPVGPTAPSPPRPAPQSEPAVATPEGPVIVPPDGVGRDVVVRVMAQADRLAAAARCLPAGVHQLRITFESSGIASRAQRIGEALTAAEAACVVQAATTAGMPPLRAASYSLIYPFTGRQE